jgi:hypothetical protein
MSCLPFGKACRLNAKCDMAHTPAGKVSLELLAACKDHQPWRRGAASAALRIGYTLAGDAVYHWSRSETPRVPSASLASSQAGFCYRTSPATDPSGHIVTR